MGRVEEKLAQLGYKLPPAWSGPSKLKNATRIGNIVWTSGAGSPTRGKLGRDLTVEQGYAAARECALQLLANLKGYIGDLDNVKQVVKLLAMVNSAPDFGEQPAVAHGCTDLLIQLYGEENGKHARSAVGMGALPNGCAVEIEMIVELKG